MNQTPTGGLSRRKLVASTGAFAAACLAMASSTPAEPLARAAETGDALPWPPVLTSAAGVRSVARDNPRPDTLRGEAHLQAGRTALERDLQVHRVEIL